MGQVISIGHRGACLHEEENTFTSFDKALELGADMIEFDVQLTSDKVPLVVHDNNLLRTTGHNIPVRTTSYDDIHRIKTKGGHPIPLLKDVLVQYGDKVMLNIELKAPGSGAIVGRMIGNNCTHQMQENLLISAFSFRELKDLRRMLPNIKIGLLYFGIPLNLKKKETQLHPYSVHFNKEFYSKKFIRRIQTLDMKAFVYTCDSEKDIEKFKALGVDGIFTGKPELI